MDKFVNYFSRFSSLSAAESAAIKGNMCVRTFKKGDFLLKGGQFSIDTFFILEGCVREYRIIDAKKKQPIFSPKSNGLFQ